jgi:TIR domain
MGALVSSWGGDRLDYRYDVFLSYRAAADWPMYISKHFLPKFRHWLGNELGRAPKIFYDEQTIEAGENFVDRLTNGLAQSKVMVCLWSKAYWKSEWCAAELRLMLRRRRSLGRAAHRPTLIIAVVIHDSEDLDPSLKDIQLFYLQEHASPWIAEGSLMEQELAEKIKELTRAVAKAIENAPEFDPKWEEHIDDQLRRVFRSTTKKPTAPKLA